MKPGTKLAQAGTGRDPATGSITTPIYQVATFEHPALGQSTGYDYSRSGNPTRKALEETIAELEGGTQGFAFSSGMAAITSLMFLFSPGDHLIVTEDLYGGTYRLFEKIFHTYGVTFSYVDTSDLEKVGAAITSKTKGIFLETPTNPLLKVADIREFVKIGRSHNLLVIVDNTFMSPYLQQPLVLGADVVVHSASKYLGGHNDVIAGLVAVNNPTLGEKIYFYQNAVGAVLGPQDCWLLLRGLKTLGLRMDRQIFNATRIALWLQDHPLVTRVYYPGLSEHPGFEIQQKQATGAGGMLSFQVVSRGMAEQVINQVKLIKFAESLGGVESLITYPTVQTHADIPVEIREALGISETLLRLSVGIEHVDDLLEDLVQALRNGR